MIFKRSSHRLLMPLASVLLFLFLWQMVGRWGLLEAKIIATPKELFLAAIEELKAGRFHSDLWISFKRVFPGIVIGTFVGMFVGLITGRVRFISQTFGTIFHMLRALPAVALVPIFIKLFGIDEPSKYIIISTGVFFPVWVSTHVGVTLVSKDYLNLARNLKITRFNKFTKIIIPSAFSHTVGGIRIGIAIAYIMLFVSEWIGSNAGIGYRLSIAYLVSRYDLMVLGLVELGLLAYLTDTIFTNTVFWLNPWMNKNNNG